MAVNFSGKNHVDALLEGFSWTGTTGTATSISYFISSYSTAEATQIRNAMKTWENVANVTFTQAANSNSAEITVERENLEPGVLGETTTSYYPFWDLAVESEVKIDTQFSGASAFGVGSEGAATVIHELGHALGLEHPRDYGQGELAPHLPASEDNFEYTLMSYYDTDIVGLDNPPSTPMIYDIAAIQYIYGANHNYNSGNTVYKYNGTKKVETLWDGAGTDTIDASTYTKGSVTIDVREGGKYYSKIGSAYVWNAFGAKIENGIGTAYADKFYGNDLKNHFTGNSGNDSMEGFNSLDTLVGGRGTDTLRGGNHDDLIYGDNTKANKSDGADLLYGDAQNDRLYGLGGHDKLYGGVNNDSLEGGDGNDTLSGDAGNDTLNGGAGNDVFYFAASYGDDKIRVFDGEGVSGGDVIHLASLNMNGTKYASMAALLKDIDYVSGNAVLHFGANDLVIAGVTKPLIASDFKVG